MKELKLPCGKYTLLDDEDYEKYKSYAWRIAGPGYVARNEVITRKGIRNQNSIILHREIMGLVKHDGLQVDHKNGNKLDNRKVNLRVCSHANNQKNMNKPKILGLTSKYKGVASTRSKKFPWRARIQLNGVQILIGTFKTEIGAATAYNLMAILCFGEYANLNSIGES